MSGAAGITGVGADGPAGTATVDSSGFFTAKTSGSGTGRGAASPEPSVRGGAIAGAALIVRGGAIAGVAVVVRGGAVAGAALGVALGLAAAFGVARAVRFALGTIASAVRPGAGAGVTDGPRTSAPTTGRLVTACCNGSLADDSGDSATATCAGMSTARRSGASIRRSRQGNPMPGSPTPSPKVRPNSSVCSSRESSSASARRRRSAIVRRRCHGPKRKARADRSGFDLDGGVRAVPGPIERKSAPLFLLGHCIRMSCRGDESWGDRSRPSTERGRLGLIASKTGSIRTESPPIQPKAARLHPARSGNEPLQHVDVNVTRAPNRRAKSQPSRDDGRRRHRWVRARAGHACLSKLDVGQSRRKDVRRSGGLSAWRERTKQSRL